MPNGSDRRGPRERALEALAAMTEEEDAAIDAGMAHDPDSPELTDEDFVRLRPAEEAEPEVVATYRRTRGPQKAPTKRLVSLRLDREVVARFRATGPGWQARINEALRRAVGL